MHENVGMRFFFLTCLLVMIGGCAAPAGKFLTHTVVLNVLDKALYDDCHIPGSVHVPFTDVENYVRGMDKNQEIIVYCSNYACTTSHYVAEKLYRSGFANVLVYEGGIAEWWQHGLPTEGLGLQSYLTKHVEPAEEQMGSGSTIKTITMDELARKLHVTAPDHVE
jgi:rhodanese-related sulfurtransferase